MTFDKAKWEREDYKKNPQKKRKYDKQYYLKNKDKITKRVAKWQKENRARLNATIKIWKKKYSQTPEGIYKVIRDNARKKKRKFLSKSDFISWYIIEPKICIYCGIKEGKKRLSIDRKDNNKGYLIDNITLACDLCNSVKGADLTYDEMKQVGKIIKKRYKRGETT